MLYSILLYYIQSYSRLSGAARLASSLASAPARAGGKRA